MLLHTRPPGPLAGVYAVQDSSDCQGSRAQADGGSGSSKVSIDGLLQLRPKRLETAAWQSASALRLMKSLDSICLTNSVLVAIGLVWVFYHAMGRSQLSQAVFFGVMAVLQLAMLKVAPTWYQRHRFKMTLYNRLMRLAVVGVVALTLKADEMRRMKESIVAVQLEAASSQPPRWVPFLRMLLGAPVFWLNHANFVLPFAYVLPAQLPTCLSVCLVSRYTTCLMLEQPEVLQVSQQLCQGIKLAMHYAAMLLGRWPPEAAAAAASECKGVDGLVLVVYYFNVAILVVLPCLVVYFMELDLKLGFIKQHSMIMQHAGPIVESRLGKAIVVYGAVVGSYMASEVMVLSLSPFECNSAGGLTPSAWLRK